MMPDFVLFPGFTRPPCEVPYSPPPIGGFPPASRPAEIARRKSDLVSALRCKGWLTARELKDKGFSDRDLREIVEHDLDGDIFSHPGSPGYKLFDDVTEAEFDRCLALKNQGEKMIRRWAIYQRRHHRRQPRK